jgi:hypothetical protein
MTVTELIAALGEFPKGAVVEVFEDGHDYRPAATPKAHPKHLVNGQAEWCSRPSSVNGSCPLCEANVPTVLVVIIDAD